MNYLVMGPWFHCQINRQGTSHWAVRLDDDTAE